MKIALCHESVLPRRGGCERYVVGLAARLLDDGHDVRLYARRWDAPALPTGLAIHPVPSSARPRLLRQWNFSRALRRLLAASDHDVSLAFDKVAGVDVLYPLAGAHPATIEASLRKYSWGAMRGLMRLARWLDPADWSFCAVERSACRHPGTAVVAISDMVRGHLRASYAVEESRLHRLPLAVLPEASAPLDRPRRRDQTRSRWGLAPDRPVALFAAMNYRLKGLEPLLHSLARVRAPLDLVVVGQEESAPFLRLARRLGIAGRLRFVGYCADMRDAYLAADLLVHPTFHDPCSTVVLEALAHGLPVLTTRYNGAAELLAPSGPDGECREGFVVDDPHDHARMGQCLEKLADARLRERCSAEARIASLRWTFEDHYAGLMEILALAARRREPLPGPTGTMAG